jgi:hypothetical protein
MIFIFISYFYFTDEAIEEMLSRPTAKQLQHHKIGVQLSKLLETPTVKQQWARQKVFYFLFFLTFFQLFFTFINLI